MASDRGGLPEGPLAPEWDDLIVLCAGVRYDGVKMADQHLAEALSVRRPVLYVDPPMSRLTALRNPDAAAALEGPRLRRVSSGLARLTPVIHPFPSRPGVAALSTAVLRRLIGQAASRLSLHTDALVSTWVLHDPAGACREDVAVWWAQDDLAAGGRLLGVSGRRLRAGERRAGRRADLVMAVSPVLARRWAEAGASTVLMPNGVDSAAWAEVGELPVPPDVDLPRPVAGFVGHINDRIDLTLLEAVADRGQSLLIVGPVSAGGAGSPGAWSRLIARPNVRWVGTKAFRDLPGYLGAIDVGLVPYRDSAFNQASFPLKTLEYLAAGLPVVSTPLPANRWLDTSLITEAAGAPAFAGAAGRWGEVPASPAARAERRAFAAGHDWTRRADALLEELDRARARCA
ncbi:MAG TPA: glycosyltransferase [Actinomycetota bacterium]|nr:glycosyltransferase [Actinomycetota bacterium]